MVTKKEYLKGAIVHGLLLFLNFCVLLGIITSIPIIAGPSDTIPILNVLLLEYMLVHSSILLSIQLGFQVLDIMKKRYPSFLIFYYFNISDQETIPEPLLDPIKSKLAVIIILLVLSGGIIIYPIFAITGMLLLVVRIPNIVGDPPTIIEYFKGFLNLVPPLLLIAVAIIVLSIILIEFKRQ